MNTTIEIEQFDNGKTFKVTTDIDNRTSQNIVVQSHNENEKLGELILEDVKEILSNDKFCGKMRLVINYYDKIVRYARTDSKG